MTRKLKGIAAAPGVAIAPVVQFHTTLDHIPMWKVAAGAVAAEQARLSGAVAEVTQSLIAFQDSTIASVISVPDILHETNILNAREQNPIFLYSSLAIIYFIACYSLSLLVRHLERRNDLRMQAA